MEMPWSKKKEEAKKPEVPRAPEPEKLESNVTLPPEPEQATTPKTVEPIQSPVPVVEAVAPQAPKPVVDAFTLAMFIWAMYRMNIITRIQVRDFLNIIKRGDWPADVVKYLTDEVKKL